MNNNNEHLAPNNQGAPAASEQTTRKFIVAQPALGLTVLSAVIALSLFIIGRFNGDFFASWVTFFMVITVPLQIVLSMLWRTQYPRWVGTLQQPFKGLVLVILTLLGACLLSVLIFYTQAEQVGPPTPMTLMYVIFCVLVTFWFVMVWQCWPLSSLTQHPALLGVGTLLVVYGIGYLLYGQLFNFSSMLGAPFYVASLDPHGAFAALDMLSFAVTSVSVIFAAVLFDFWPLSQLTVLRNPLLMLLARTTLVLVCTSGVFWLATRGLSIDPVKFMVHGSIALLFGTLVPLLMFEGKSFDQYAQPLKGLLQLGIACLFGAVLPNIYWFLAPTLSGSMPSGAPTYAHEFWLASALLAITFPLLVVFSQFFDFWPLRRR